tara:strand:- start:596 stop:1066 length:471 start_codon:yes stop_codon:yes gene_type:complete
MDLNTKIEQALNNKDIVKIMNKASQRFNSQLDRDTIHTCQINALWKSFVNFKPEKNTKFTTYLYNGVFIECLKEIKFINKSKKCTGKLHKNMVGRSEDGLLTDVLDELESDEEKSLILDRISKMTINEIAKKHGVSRETIRKKLKKIVNRFQYKFV